MLTHLTLACLALQATIAPPLVVLATHEEPTEQELRFLRTPPPEWEAEAAQAGYQMRRESEALLVWHENLFNLKAMEDIIRGLEVAQAFIMSDGSLLDFQTLTPEQQDTLRRLVASSNVGSSVRGRTRDIRMLVLDLDVEITLDNGRRQYSFTRPFEANDIMGKPLPDALFIPHREPEDLDQNEGLALRPYPETLQFHFTDTQVVRELRSLGSARRVRASERLASLISEMLEDQQARYTERRRSVVEAAEIAANRIHPLPLLGSDASLLDERELRAFHLMKDDPQRHGFQNAAEIDDLLSGARVSRVQVRPRIGVGYTQPGGGRIVGAMNLTFNRNPR